MRNRLDEQLESLNGSIIDLGMVVGSAIAKAITALKNNDRDMALSVAQLEEKSNEMEKYIESAALRLLLSQQPVARDLRLVSAALKIITDMERIGDQALDIAEITLQIIGRDYRGATPQKISEMAREAVVMVNNAVDSYVSQDEELARQVIASDDIVDDLFAQVRDELVFIINQNEENGEQAIDFVMIAKYLERIGDHAVNIAERVLFMITGKME